MLAGCVSGRGVTSWIRGRARSGHNVESNLARLCLFVRTPIHAVTKQMFLLLLLIVDAVVVVVVAVVVVVVVGGGGGGEAVDCCCRRCYWWWAS